MTDFEAGYAAVYRLIDIWDTDVFTNAMIWRAVQAYSAAIGHPMEEQQ